MTIRNAMLWVFLTVAMLVTCSCSTVKYVPVETIKNDSIYIAQVEHDSIYVKDSIYIKESADTVWVNRVQWKYRDRVVRDTVRVAQDRFVEKAVEVERKLTSWQSVKMSVGGYAIVCSAILVAIWFAKRLKGL